MLVVAGGNVVLSRIEALVEQGVEFGRIAAEGRLYWRSIDDDGHLGAFRNVNRAGKADDAVLIDSIVDSHCL